jgi:catechol 2,3-dioxygenase-like lactoylglutathione lyase family enzyme
MTDSQARLPPSTFLNWKQPFTSAAWENLQSFEGSGGLLHGLEIVCVAPDFSSQSVRDRMSAKLAGADRRRSSLGKDQVMNLPNVRGIHHVKFPVRDLEHSLTFYEAAFGARRISAFDHRHGDGSLYALILEVPGLGTYLELRLNPRLAERERGFDPMTISVEDRASLEQWIEHLDAAGFEHSPILTAVQGWLVVFEDPDGRRLRLYTLETHGPELPPDETSPWLAEALTGGQEVKS